MLCDFECISGSVSKPATYDTCNRRWNYDSKTLEKAFEAVLTGQMTPSMAAKVYGVPKTTLYSRRSRVKSFQK